MIKSVQANETDAMQRLVFGVGRGGKASRGVLTDCVGHLFQPGDDDDVVKAGGDRHRADAQRRRTAGAGRLDS
jgi:hypothetical protein